jgi:hypothetical protein
MADRDKERAKLKEEGYIDAIIESMLYTEEEIQKMKDEIDEIWKSMDLIEDNSLKVNIVSIQLLTMFSFNLKTTIKPPDGKKNVALDLASGFNYTDFYTTRNYFKKSTNEFACLSGHNDKGLPFYFLISIYNLTVSNILDSLFEHNLWLLGFSSRFLYIDGLWGSPWYYAIHDTEHWDISIACHEPCYKFVHGANNDINEGFKIICNFYKYCKNEHGNTALGYSLKVAIFLAIHEFGTASDGKIWFSDPTDQIKFKKGIIVNYINEMIDRFTNKNDLFELLPRRIREQVDAVEREEEKRKEIVMRYFHDEVVQSFVIEYAKFLKIPQLPPPIPIPAATASALPPPHVPGGNKTKKRKYKKRRRKSRGRKSNLGKLR